MAKYFEKFEGLREVSHIYPNWCLFASYWSWDLIEKVSRRKEEKQLLKRDWTQGSDPHMQRLVRTVRGNRSKRRTGWWTVSHQRQVQLRQNVTCASGQWKSKHRNAPDFDPRQVIGPRTGLVMNWDILELSIYDRTQSKQRQVKFTCASDRWSQSGLIFLADAWGLHFPNWQPPSAHSHLYKSRPTPPPFLFQSQQRPILFRTPPRARSWTLSAVAATLRLRPLWQNLLSHTAHMCLPLSFRLLILAHECPTTLKVCRVSSENLNHPHFDFRAGSITVALQEYNNFTKYTNLLHQSTT
jgi:hypothetical protein